MRLIRRKFALVEASSIEVLGGGIMRRYVGLAALALALIVSASAADAQDFRGDDGPDDSRPQ